MDHHYFAAFTRSLGAAASRRSVGRALAGTGFGALFGACGAPDVQAKKKRKNRKKKKKKQQQPVLNAFGCVDVGQPCRGDSTLCCSGICEGLAPKKGRPDTSVCVVHNTDVCTPSTDTCTVGVEVPCGTGCFCTITTGNASFCAAFSGGTEGHCRVCSKDTDCQAEFGPGAACLVLGGICTPFCVTTGTTACAPPCA